MPGGHTDTEPESSPPTVRKAGERDLAAVGRILAAAFDDEPVFSWLVRQDSKRRGALERFFSEAARQVYLPLDECYITDDGSGAALWVPPPRQTEISFWDQVRWVPLFLRDMGLRRLRRFGQLLGATEEHHPETPHSCL